MTLTSRTALSPGNNLDPLGLPLDLSAGPNMIPAGSAPYELFTGNSDVANATFVWSLDATGTPTSQN